MTQSKQILAKPLAALSSGLLARKGSARPAMRPQGFAEFDAIPQAQDDLGWNDMGDGAPVPPVLVQREALHEEFAPLVEAPATSRAVSLATAVRIGRETRALHEGETRSAFTLRLDGDRHLKLRLASALHNKSAQLLVTEALDAFFATLPDVGALLDQLPARAPR